MLNQTAKELARDIGKGKLSSVEVTDFFIDRIEKHNSCLLYTSPSPRDLSTSRMPSSA